MFSKACVALCLLLISRQTSAQVQVALFGGPQATSANYKIDGRKQPIPAAKYGFAAGAGMKVPFEGRLYFFPSLYYSLKGYKVTLKDPSFPPTEYAKNNNTTIHTAELSPMFHIDLSAKPRHLFVRFGPAVDFAFSGHEKFDTVSVSGNRATVSRPMVFSFGDYGRLTASVNGHLGYESGKGWMVYAFYNHGLGSMNNADGGPRILHRIGGFCFGWLIGRNPLVMDTRVRE